MSVVWKSKITGYGEVDPASLRQNERNWRTHPATQRAALSGVLSEIGVVQNVIFNQHTGRLVDGHLRVDLAIEHKQPTVPVTYVYLSDTEEAAILATLDPLSALAGMDADKLGALMTDFSFESSAVNDMLTNLFADDVLADDEPAAEAETDSTAGEVEETMWPTVSVRVAPQTLQVYLSLQDMLRGDNEADRFADLVNRAASTL